jgi:hypothetical protein
MKEIKVYKEPSKLSFQLADRDDSVALSTTERGDVFLRDGAVCMRVEVESSLDRAAIKEGKAYLINLQTGRVWPAEGTDRIRFVQAVVTLEGE